MFDKSITSGSTTSQHAWMANALFDLAAYAAKNGLTTMHEQLSLTVAVALNGGLETEVEMRRPPVPVLENVFDLRKFR
ncbi:MAG: hypothetical protein WBA90_08690 [Albidovulum sp.]|jgi:hypothetical protein